MLTKTQKAKIVEELTDDFKRQKITIFSDFSGISVSNFRALRRALKKENAEYKVAKKTLFDRALEGVGIQIKSKELKGEIGVTFGYGDQVAPAKVLTKFSKDHETFKVLAGILGERILAAKDILALAKLPSREILLGQIAATLQSPIRGLAMALQANIKNLAVVLSKIKK